MPEREDYYQILGVDPKASEEEIKKAYRDKCFILHPDRLQGAPESARTRAEEELKGVNAAYGTLGNPQRRKDYDYEWLKRVKEQRTTFVETPKPVVEPSFIRFRDVKPGETQTTSFIIRNTGGPYTKIWFSNPDSWVRVVRWFSRTDSDELPLRVEIEAEGEDWGKSYTEHIIVRLTNEETGAIEETQVSIELQTKAEPIRERYARLIYTTRARPTYTPPPPSLTPKPTAKPHRRGVPVLLRWVLGLMVLIIIGRFGGQFWSSGLLITSSKKKIVFSSGDRSIPPNFDIYSINRDGGRCARLTKGDWPGGMYPVWSPDKKRIAFVSREVDDKIYIMNADGNDLVRLTKTEKGEEEHYPEWSPDGTRIAFIRSQSHDDKHNEICIIDINGNNQIRLTPEQGWADRGITWSPDGEFIGYTSKKGMYKIRIDGSEHFLLIPNMKDGARERQWSYPDWSPDGRWIALQRPTLDREGNASYSIWLYNVDTKRLSHLIGGEDFAASFPAWSPDGRYIAFYRQRSYRESSSIGIVDTEGIEAKSVISFSPGSLLLGLNW